MNYWKTYRSLIGAWVGSLVLLPLALINFTPRIVGFADSLLKLDACFLGLVLVRIVVGIARKEQGRFVTFYTILLCSAALWLPLIVNLKLHLTKP